MSLFNVFLSHSYMMKCREVYEIKQTGGFRGMPLAVHGPLHQAGTCRQAV